MPTVVTIIAIRAGLKDARKGEPAFLWGVIVRPAERRRRLHGAWKDIARIFVVALVLDTVYQFVVFRAFFVEQALIVAVVCAVVPYVLFRGPATRLARGLSRKRGGATNTLEVNTTEGEEGNPESQDRVDARGNDL
jgi:hypothetical protein